MKRLDKTLVHVFVGLLGMGVLSACVSVRTESVKVASGQGRLLPDSSGSVNLDVAFHVPEGYISKRSRLVISPFLAINGNVKEDFAPIVLDAPIYEQKLNRKKIIENYIDTLEQYKYQVEWDKKSFGIGYHKSFILPEETVGGCVYAIVSTDGCAECTALDTLFVASVNNLPSLMEPIKPSLLPPPSSLRPKIIEGGGFAVLQFEINRHEIKPEKGNNRKEMERMVNELRPVLEDSLATLEELRIYGMASADGPYAFNEALAFRRARAAREWISEKLLLPSRKEKQIQLLSKPEGWWPVYQAMLADDHPDTLSVKHILTRYSGENDDVPERYIRRLSCWSDIKNQYLPEDRKVEYTYKYTLKNFTTEAELLLMYERRPDAMNEDELLRAASLMKNDSARIKAYQVTLSFFPQSGIAAHNLAALYLQENRIEEARRVLESQKQLSSELKMLQSVCSFQSKDYNDALSLLEGIALPQADYLRGLIKARQQKLDEAYALLASYKDVNVALLALALGKDSEAKAVMDRLSDETPWAEYVRALLAARAGNEAAFRDYLEKACVDRILRERAENEPDFKQYMRKETWNNRHMIRY